MRSSTRTVSLLIIATGASLLGDAALYSVLPSNYLAAGIAATSVGLVLSANRLIRLFTNSAVGSVIDRTGRRRPFMLGMILAVLSTMGYSFSHSLAVLLSARLVWGIAWSLVAVSGHSMILDLSSPTDRGRLVGTYRGLTFLGGSFGMLAGGVLSDSLGFHPTFLILGLATGIGLAASMGLQETRPSSPADPCHSAAAPPSHTQPSTSESTLTKGSPRDRRLWIAAALNLVSRFFLSGVMVSTLGRYIDDLMITWPAGAGLSLGTASLTGMLLFLRSLLSIGSAPAFGHLADRSGSRFWVMLVGLALGVAGFGSLALSTGLWTILIGVILTALSDSALPTAAAAWVGDFTAEDRRGAAVGLYATIGDVGAGLAPLTAYSAASAWGLDTVYTVCAAALLISLLTLAWVVRRRPFSIDRPPRTTII